MVRKVRWTKIPSLRYIKGRNCGSVHKFSMENINDQFKITISECPEERVEAGIDATNESG